LIQRHLKSSASLQTRQSPVLALNSAELNPSHLPKSSNLKQKARCPHWIGALLRNAGTGSFAGVTRKTLSAEAVVAVERDALLCFSCWGTF
jgi:hypothetical protein